MKKIFIIVALLLAANLQLGAIPASKTGFVWTQPDGSKITLYRYGDEFCHWTGDANGAVYTLTEDGWYRRSSSTPRPASYHNENRRRQAAQMRAAYRAGSDMTHGSRHIPVILVEFYDKSFTITDPANAFSALLNQEGYSANGGTGSVKDYYVSNSGGQFTPIFDVYGPVRLTNKMSYYGANDGDEDVRPEIALYEALLQLDETVDFSIYDSDNDGNVDMTLFYYAGWNEAEGASEDTIWPHQWTLDGSSNVGARNNRFDGVHFGRYFCTSELKGKSGSNMCGIGTTCHEFAHSLGLPDFYDTDYEKSGGENGALYNFSLMCSGAYNNNGCTPPYMIAEERIMLGWMDRSAMQEITETGSYTLQSVENNVAYMISSDTEGEYFYLETRGGQNWDKYLPTGLLVYHADKSKDRKVGNSSYTPFALWNDWESSNAINKWGAHPCFYIIVAKDQTNLNYSGYMRDVVFPTNSGSVTSYQPIDWNGVETAAQISSIAYSSGKVTFNVTVTNAKGVSGTVTDSSGNPLQGVTISVATSGQNNIVSHGNVRIVSLRDAVAGAQYSTQTDAQGHYSIDLQDCTATSVEVSATLDGYVDKSQTVTLKSKGNVVDFVLLRVDESLPTDLGKWNKDGESQVLGLGNTSTSLMFATMFSETELAGYSGDLIQSVTMLPNITSGNLYVIIDFGSTRALTYKVPNPVYGQEITVSLESFDLHIPQNGDVYIGYGLENYDNGYPFVCYSPASYGCFYDMLNLSSSDWGSLVDYDLYLSVTVQKENEDPGTIEDPIAYAGFSYIKVPADFSFTSGAVLPLELVLGRNTNPMSIVWTLDGEVVRDSITLTSGNHTLRAILFYSGGSDETIELEMEVL